MKFKLKLHTPSWHSHGSKYKIGNWLTVRGVRRGRLGVSFRTGWREHDHNRGDTVDYAARAGKRIGTLMRPQASAFDLAVQGNYGNPLRSRYG